MKYFHRPHGRCDSCDIMNYWNAILFFLGVFKCQICMFNFTLNSINVISDSIVKFCFTLIDDPSYCITSSISKNKQQHSKKISMRSKETATSEREQGKKYLPIYGNKYVFMLSVCTFILLLTHRSKIMWHLWVDHCNIKSTDRYSVDCFFSSPSLT